MASGWQLTADTGGTFTDCLGRGPDGSEHRVKVLSSASLRGVILGLEDNRRLRVRVEWTAPANFCVGFAVGIGGVSRGRVSRDTVADGWLELEDDWEGLPPAAGSLLELQSAEEAPVLAARLMTATPAGHPLPDLELRLGTTRGTNALLEGKGAPVALFVSRGFADLCRIGTQQRPELFDLEIRRPEPLYRQVFEVPGRYALDGAELEPLDLSRLDQSIAEAVSAGCRVAAVALIHSYRHPAHEEAVVAHLQKSGAFAYVVGSADLRPFIHYLRRTETALVDATLGPVMESYLDAVEAGLGSSRLRVMTSGGSLLSRARFRPVDSLLSGPAGGVAGAALAGQRAGLPRLVAFDMGGTSTDVSRWDGDFAYQAEQRVGPAKVFSRSVKIETVAAGGGSICGFDGQRLFVGPESAGASPGPACYGAGGPLTVTDVNLLLGRLDPAAFHIPVSVEAAEVAWQAVHAAIEQSGVIPDHPSAKEELLAGLLQLANERMAQAIRQISVRDGYDPARFGLVAFGGAGGMHACAVAEILGIETIVFPLNAGLLSAEGLAHAALDAIHERQLLCSISEWIEKRRAVLDELRIAARTDLAAEGLPLEVGVAEEASLDLRLLGQEATLTVADGADPRAAFLEQYETIFGYCPAASAALEVVRVRLRLCTVGQGVETEDFDLDPSSGTPESERVLQSWFDGKCQAMPVFTRACLPVGHAVEGPALVTDPFSTLVIAPGWCAVKGNAGSLRLQVLAEKTDATRGTAPVVASDLVQRELLLHRFEALVEEMGEQLRRTALSTNIRERLDFSCALLDAEGTLLVNAPHIPVHLGALGECVRRVLAVLPLRPGDVIVTNHPAYGGSHLPDVTVISGVFAGDRLVAILANRAHHAEIGGTRPGSMPPDARCLAEEGVVLVPSYLVEQGISRFSAVEARLRGGPHPSRAVAENVADLHAQVAANRRGAQILDALLASEGVEPVVHFLQAAADLSEAAARRCFRGLGNASFKAADALDDGTPIVVSATVEGAELTLDFSGSGGVHSGNFNATPAIVRSAVLYVLRLLMAEPLPLNEGMLRPVTLIIPPGLLNPLFSDDPEQCPAVVGGNVETSQRLVDVLLTAFDLLAQGQGTMNNVLFGDDSFGYYETVGGGAGAGNGFSGASGVHVHMTNTAITDPEILEHRYPLRIRRFALRRNSGGDGCWRGGDGLIREYEFLRDMRVSLLAQRRTQAPKGAAGGSDGMPGRQYRVSPDGVMEELPGQAAWDPVAGERLVLETPGGGGWGSA